MSCLISFCLMKGNAHLIQETDKNENRKKCCCVQATIMSDMNNRSNYCKYNMSNTAELKFSLLISTTIFDNHISWSLFSCISLLRMPTNWHHTVAIETDMCGVVPSLSYISRVNMGSGFTFLRLNFLTDKMRITKLHIHGYL